MKQTRALLVPLSLLMITGFVGCGDDTESPRDTGPQPDLPVQYDSYVTTEDGMVPDTFVAPDSGVDSFIAPDTITTTDMAEDTTTTPDQGTLADAAQSVCSKVTAITLAGGSATASDEILDSETINDVQIPSSGCVGQTTEGAERFYSVQLTGGQMYKISVDPEQGTGASQNYNVALYLSSDCADMANTCVAGADVNLSDDPETVVFTPPTDGTYYIGIDSRYAAGSSYSYGRFTLTIDEANPPTNDTCAGADTITFTSGKAVLTGETMLASNDVALTSSDCTGTTVDGPDLFFKVQMSSSNVYKLTLDGTGFDEVLFIFSDCNNPVGTCGQGMGADEWSSSDEELTFSPPSDGLYYIAVSGSGASDAGTFELTVEEFVKPTNDNCGAATPLTLVSGAVQTTGHTIGATDRVNLTAADCTGDDTEGGDVYYSVTLTQGSKYLIQATPESGYNLALYVLSDCVDPTTKCVAGADTEYSGDPEMLVFTPTQTGSYVIVVDSNYPVGDSYAEGSFTLDIKEILAPANDTCGNAEQIQLSGGTATVTGENLGAANDVALTSSDCTGDSVDGPDTFYELAVTAGMAYTIELDGTGFDEVLYLFTDCNDPAGSCVAGIDDWSSSSEETTYIPQATGTLIIGVAGQSATDVGTYTLTVNEFQVAQNNTCGTAEPMTFSGTPAVASVSANTATGTNTVQLTSSGCTGWSSSGKDLFYSITLNAGQSYTVTVTPDVDFDPMVFVFTDCNDPQGSCVAGDDSTYSGEIESVTFTPSTTGLHYIGVGAFSSTEEGTFTLEVQ